MIVHELIASVEFLKGKPTTEKKGGHFMCGRFPRKSRI